MSGFVNVLGREQPWLSPTEPGVSPTIPDDLEARLQTLESRVMFSAVTRTIDDDANNTRYFVIENGGVWRVNKRDEQGVISSAESATQVTNLTEARNLTYA